MLPFLAAFLELLFLAGTAGAQTTRGDLSQASLEDLMKIEVTTVSKHEQALSTAAAAVHVITREEIRRSGATTLPEVLRLAPGIQVAQVTSNTWAISIRGFNSQFANKLLVLIDGRTVYTPSFSGVFWNEQNLPLEEIERIEVIRGPGATLWGTNAVNGVINIITREARNTPGVHVVTGSGSLEHATAYARFGAKAGSRGSYRLYLKHSRLAELPVAGGLSANDGWYDTRGGIRLDLELSPYDSLTLEGEGDGGRPNDSSSEFRVSAPFFGYPAYQNAHVMARWRRQLSDNSELTTLVYFDHAQQAFPEILEMRNDTFNLDLQHNFQLGGRNHVMWGGTFRNIRQRTWGTAWTQFAPAARDLRIFSGFAQDEIVVVPRIWTITVGSKFESNVFTGVDLQPSLRFVVTPTARQAFWGSVSQAMRSPSELETSARFLLPGIETPWGRPPFIVVTGNPHPRSEELVACEAGYRTQVTPQLSFDIAAFWNVYHHLAELRVPSMPFLSSAIPLTFAYDAKGRNVGAEVAVNYVPRKSWRLTASYTGLSSTVRTTGGMPYFSPSLNPKHQFQLHSYLSLLGAVELDAHLYFVARLPDQPVSGYTRADMRLGWRPNSHLEFSLVGRNLLDASHAEFFTGFQPLPIQVRRSVYAQIDWKF